MPLVVMNQTMLQTGYGVPLSYMSDTKPLHTKMPCI